MTCKGNCNQGRNCDCANSKSNRSTVIVTSLLFIAIVSMAYGVYNLLHGTERQDCAVEVQFGNGVKATYLGTSI
jgi:hypothetical protein